MPSRDEIAAYTRFTLDQRRRFGSYGDGRTTGRDVRELHLERQARVCLHLHCFNRYRLESGGFDGDVISARLEVSDGKSAVIAGLSVANLPGFDAGYLDLSLGNEGVIWVFDGADNRALVVLGKGGDRSQQNEQKQGDGGGE